MKKLFLAVLIVILFTSIGSGSDEQVTKTSISRVEEYNLSEQCGEAADTFFKIRYSLTDGRVAMPGVSYKTTDTDDTNSDFVIHEYRNHYNKKLNKCFVIIETAHLSGKVFSGVRLQLYDANEHKLYGEYIGNYKDAGDFGKPFECYFSKYSCKSEKEWETLIKPYMEE